MSYIVVDLETTGLYPTQGDEIVEIGAIKIENNQLTEEIFQTFVKPVNPISPEAQKISGITNKDLKKAPSIQEVMPQFLSFIGSKLLIAQNAKFDLSFILEAVKKCGLPPFSNNFIDTMLLSKKIFFYEKTHNLDIILKRLNILHTMDRHRSIDDCRLTGLAFLKMVENLEQKGQDNLKAIGNCFVKPEESLEKRRSKKPLPQATLFE